MQIDNIIEKKEILEFLVSKNLLTQYKKCKSYLYAGVLKSIDFKIHKQKKNKIYYFRINKQYRALCIIENNELRVFNIDDHS